MIVCSSLDLLYLSMSSYLHFLPNQKSGYQLQVLKNLINASLDQAETDEYQTIAFPALGTGMLGYPTDRVVEIFFSCLEHASTRAQSLEDVFLVIFPKDRDTFKVVTILIYVFFSIVLYINQNDDGLLEIDIHVQTF